MNLHPWQRTRDHGVWRLTLTAHCHCKYVPGLVWKPSSPSHDMDWKKCLKQSGATGNQAYWSNQRMKLESLTLCVTVSCIWETPGREPKHQIRAKTPHSFLKMAFGSGRVCLSRIKINFWSDTSNHAWEGDILFYRCLYFFVGPNRNVKSWSPFVINEENKWQTNIPHFN